MWELLQSAGLKSKREINGSSHNPREKHLQEKWQREGNPAGKSRLSQWIYASALEGQVRGTAAVGPGGKQCQNVKNSVEQRDFEALSEHSLLE